MCMDRAEWNRLSRVAVKVKKAIPKDPSDIFTPPIFRRDLFIDVFSDWIRIKYGPRHSRKFFSLLTEEFHILCENRGTLTDKMRAIANKVQTYQYSPAWEPVWTGNICKMVKVKEEDYVFRFDEASFIVGV